jgi:hypothetical protein
VVAPYIFSGLIDSYTMSARGWLCWAKYPYSGKLTLVMTLSCCNRGQPKMCRASSPCASPESARGERKGNDHSNPGFLRNLPRARLKIEFGRRGRRRVNRGEKNEDGFGERAKTAHDLRRPRLVGENMARCHMGRR